VLARGARLFIADTGHHRVLETELIAADTAAIRRVFGSGHAGFGDGTAESAAFHSPQGLASDGTTLYVADRSNHAVRAVNLASGEVTTVAGTGLIAQTRPGAGPATGVALRSPWDVTLVEDGLLVAMAGSHQLWLVDLAAQRIAPYAGTGGEAIEDGPAREALLAQPMGLAGSQGAIAFADAESSSVRTLAMGDPGWVGTLVGTGLFDFGDVDGAGDVVRLQHAEAVCLHDTRIMVADTYNDKIKALDVDSATCRALPGAAGSGTAFSHPAGVTSDGQRLFVADTDAHRIAIVDPDSGSVSDLVITDGRPAVGDPR
jgi:DNA-binding beta-propeller fold protein YncE